MENNLHILECTLRDGSYVIDFQFTARDTAIIAAALEGAGVRLIEVGHGVGLNASNMGKGVAAATDEEYMQAASSVLQCAKWGMFFIPGIGRREDLELAASYGMDFVRIGTNATEVKQSREYIELAKKLGMYVSANLMKSYILAPKELAVEAKLSERFGVDLVCLVDSAGSMLPDDVREYMKFMQDTLIIPIGFHCHDNLALGMANVLTAIDCGCQTIDSTLQGMGRGGGNAITEVVVTVLRKRGIELGIDAHRLMDISERIIKPMLQGKGVDPMNITAGFAGFHSSHLQTILKYSKLYDVDARDLIVSLCETDRVYAPDELVEQLARQLQRRQGRRSGVYHVSIPCFHFPQKSRGQAFEESLGEACRKVARETKAGAKKKGTHSVFNIVSAMYPTGKAVVSRFIQEEFGYVIGSVEVDNIAQLKEVVEAVDGMVDVMFVDSEQKSYLDQPLSTVAAAMAKHSQVLGYRDSDVWVRSVDRLIATMLGDPYGHCITVCDTGYQSLKLALSLVEQGVDVTLTGGSTEQLKACHQVLGTRGSGRRNLRTVADSIQAARRAHVLVSFARDQALISRQMVEVIDSMGVIVDAGIGSVSAEAISYANEHGIRIIRPDMRAALAGELACVLGTQRMVSTLMGRSEVAGIPVVASGVVGQYGDVVLDSISNPSKVVGVADGQGRVIYERRPEFVDRLSKVEHEILHRTILAK